MLMSLFPEITPYVKHSLKVSDIHTLYIEECGNPKGIPALFIHGGPGAGCEPYHRRFFNPDLYRIILFDQRGCGRSSPHASIEDNHTTALVSDMEVIRQHLNIDQWLLFGGSWGSTLALCYAQAHPDKVLAMILRGIFLCRDKELQWFYQQGASRLFPDYWQDYLKVIPSAERQNMIQAYYHRLTNDDEVSRMSAAKAWSLWEARLSTLTGSDAVINHLSDPYTALSMARIECHYFINNAFLSDNQLLDNAHLIKDIPGHIIQGRYDVVCPLESAWDLHQAWPKADLNIINDAGHSASEPGISDALVRATENMARIIK